MLSIGAQSIYLYGGPADMRRSFDGLSAMVATSFPGQLLTGALFVFVNKRRNMIKVLYWHEDGLALWAKRLEKGTFQVSWDGAAELTRREFTMLLEGIVPRRMNQRFSLPNPK